MTLSEKNSQEKNSQDLSEIATKDYIISQYKLALIDSLEAQIGDLYFNYNNYYKDAQSFIKFDMEYILCNGIKLNVADYPELAKAMNIPSGETTFNLPNFLDGAIRNLEEGNSRALGSYELDALQQIKGSLLAYPEALFGDEIVSTYGAFQIDQVTTEIQLADGSIDNSVTGILFDNSKALDPNGKQVKTDDFETIMTNTSVQIYVKAKVLD